MCVNGREGVAGDKIIITHGDIDYLKRDRVCDPFRTKQSLSVRVAYTEEYVNTLRKTDSEINSRANSLPPPLLSPATKFDSRSIDDRWKKIRTMSFGFSF